MHPPFAEPVDVCLVAPAEPGAESVARLAAGIKEHSLGIPDLADDRAELGLKLGILELDRDHLATSKSWRVPGLR